MNIARDANLVKLAVDVERKIIACGCEFHIDCADQLIEDGSRFKNIWGANVYPDTMQIDFVAFLNIRPERGNRAMHIQDETVREKVGEVLKELLPI